MLKTTLHADGSIMIIEPSAKVSKANVTKACKDLKPWLDKSANALMIANESYEDWDAFTALIPNLIDEKSKSKLKSIAVVTNKPTGILGETLKELYPDAQLNIYCYFEIEAAMTWLSPEKADSAA